MTSKNSFSNMLRICIRRRIWSLALAFIGFFFAFPIYGAILISSKLRMVEWGYTKYQVAVNLIRRDFLGEGNFMVISVMMIIAVVLAVSGYSYLFSKQKVDLYFGIPIGRRTMFAADYLSGVICYLMAYLPFMILGLLIALGNQVLDGRGVATALLMLVMNLIGFLGIYTLTIIAVLLTGNLPVCLMATATFLGYFPMVYLLMQGYMSRFFLTYTSYKTGTGWLKGSPISAYVGLISGLNSYSGKGTFTALPMVGFMVYLIAAFALALFLYEKRPVEAAGKALSYKKTMPYISVLILIPVILFGGFGFEEVTRNGVKVDYFWLIAGAVIALVLGHCILQAIFYQDFRSLTKNLKNPVIAAVVSTLVMLIFILDVFGYDTYFPKEKSYDSASLSCYSLSSGQEYFDFTAEENEYGNYDVWVDTDTYRLSHMKIQDRELIRKLIEAALEDTKEEHEMAIRNTSEEYAGRSFYYMTVKYALKNGKEVYRQYAIDFNKHKDLFTPIYESQEYKEAVFQILNLEDDEIKDIIYYDIAGEQKLALSIQQQQNLIHTYQEELRAQKADVIYNEIPIGYLYRKVRFPEDSAYNAYNAYKGYVYPSFTKTIALMKEYGYQLERWNDPSNISYITVENYQPTQMDEAQTEEYAIDAAFSTGYGESILAKYDQKDQIKELMKYVYSTEFFSEDGCFHQMQDSLDVRVTYSENPDSYSDYSIFWFQKGVVPQFVLDDTQYVME